MARAQGALERNLKSRADSAYWKELNCTACHEDLVADFAGTRHGRAMEFNAWRGVTWNSCHGDSAQHIATKDPKTIENPTKQRQRRAQPG
jgi:hypothetical protein